MQRLNLTIGLIAMGVLMTSGGMANAGSSGWMSVTKIKHYMQALNRTNQLPTSFLCKENPDKLASPLIKVTFKRNTTKTRWRWAWGTHFAINDKPLLRNGYKRVSYSQARGYIGYKDKCGLWHKRPTER